MLFCSFYTSDLFGYFVVLSLFKGCSLKCLGGKWVYFLLRLKQKGLFQCWLVLGGVVFDLVKHFSKIC